MTTTTVTDTIQRGFSIKNFIFFSLVTIALAVTVPSFSYSEQIGFLMSMIFIYIITFFLKWNTSSPVLFFGLSYFFIWKIIYFFSLDPITGPDATRYFAQVARFETLPDFIEYAIRDIQQWGIFDVSSYTFFGLMYMPFYKLFNAHLPQIIAVFNSILIITSIYLWSKVVNERLAGTGSKKVLMSSLITIMFISSSFSYWSSTFLKDSASLSLGILTFYLFSKKRYALSIVTLIVAIALRPYAIAYVLCYWLFVNKKLKLSILISFLGLIYVAYEAGIQALINTLPMMGRILASPNPFNLSNWSNLFMPTLESFLVFTFIALAALVFLKVKESRMFYWTFFFTLILYSSVLTLLGYSSLLNREIEYAFFSGGDDMYRKKLSFNFVIYTMMAFTISNFRIQPRK